MIGMTQDSKVGRWINCQENEQIARWSADKKKKKLRKTSEKNSKIPKRINTSTIAKIHE